MSKLQYLYISKYLILLYICLPSCIY